MLKKLVNKAKAAIPAATKAVKKAVTAAKDKITKTVNTNAGKIKENIANTVKKTVAAIPSCVKQIEKTAQKVQAAIPSCVNAAKQKAKESADKAKTSVSNAVKTVAPAVSNSIQTLSENVNQVYTSVNHAIQNEIDCSGEKGQRILTGIWEEYQKTCEEIIKGEVYTKPFVYQHPYRQLSQGLHFLLESRKIVVEEYPVFSWMNRVFENAHQKVKKKFLKSADQFGNQVYNQNIPIVSSFTGGLFHASAMNSDKGKSNAASVTGSFLNGFLGIGVLGTVDGLVGAVADPFTALEGMNQFFYEPEKSVPVFRSYVVSELNKKLIHGNAEERSRVAGAITFEIVTAVLGELAAAKAGEQTGNAGKTAKILDKAEDMDDVADASKAAEKISQLDKAEDVLDSASDMEKAEDIIDQAADAEKAGRAAGTAKSFQRSVEEYVKKLLSSDKVGEAAEKADDIVNAVRRRLNSSGSELEPALATGQLDDVDDFDLFSRKYNEYIKEKQNVDTGGVKINKIEGEVGNGADLVDDMEIMNAENGSNKASAMYKGNGDIYSDIRKLNKEIEIVDSKGKCLGEFDEIDIENKIFYEDKTAKGLNTINPKTGKPTQTVQQFADKQIYTKTKNRINNLMNSTGTRQAKTNIIDGVPDISELQEIKKFIFRLDGDGSELRNAVGESIRKLQLEFPDYTFEAIFGK